jgi:hypothetical protein
MIALDIRYVLSEAASTYKVTEHNYSFSFLMVICQNFHI